MAKKKLSPREKRELDKQKKRQQYRQAEQRAAQEAVWSRKTDSPSGKESKKTRAKAAGLKSVFVLPDNKVVMTSFQNGNAARVEYQIKDRSISELTNDPLFQVSISGAAAQKKEFFVDGRNHISAKRDDPRPVSPAKGNLIGNKSALERFFFQNTTFEDNIHIQLIHCILDIEKILSVYVNSIIYELNNILQRAKPDMGRLDVMLISKKNRDEYKELFHQPQLAYFADAFYQMDEGGIIKPRSEDEIFLILRIISDTRHSLTHFKSRIKPEKAEHNLKNDDMFLYRLDNSAPKQKDVEVIRLLDRFYE